MPLRGDELERETTRKAEKAASDPRNTGQEYSSIPKRQLKKMMREESAGEAPEGEVQAQEGGEPS